MQSFHLSILCGHVCHRSLWYLFLCRPEDLRIPFERFGPIKDIYLPKNYYTGLILFPQFLNFFPRGSYLLASTSLSIYLALLSSFCWRLLAAWLKICREPRGFGFVKFQFPEDAAEAKAQLNRTVIGGREIRIVFAEENRKTPHEMRRHTRVRCENILACLIYFIFVIGSVRFLGKCFVFLWKCSLIYIFSYIPFFLLFLSLSI